VIIQFSIILVNNNNKFSCFRNWYLLQATNPLQNNISSATCLLTISTAIAVVYNEYSISHIFNSLIICVKTRNSYIFKTKETSLNQCQNINQQPKFSSHRLFQYSICWKTCNLFFSNTTRMIWMGIIVGKIVAVWESDNVLADEQSDMRLLNSKS